MKLLSSSFGKGVLREYAAARWEAETDDELLALNDVAGPPEKVLRYLRALSEMSEVLLEKGALGRSIPMWLKERNVDCSVESETARGNKDSRKFRTRQINGVETECDYHAKPSDGVSPDTSSTMC